MPHALDFNGSRGEEKRNFLLHGFEGGFYIGGLGLVAADTVAPAMVALLGGGDALVALMPMLTFIGMSISVLAFAHRVERLPRVMPFARVLGLLQRLPYLAAGLALLWCADKASGLVLALVMFAPLASGLCGGAGYPAWSELVSKTVSKRRRSSMLALRNIVAGLLGIAAGAVIHSTLEHTPGHEGFALLHLYLFGALMLSFLLFVCIREPVHEHRNSVPARTLWQNLREIPGLLASDRSLRNFTAMRLLAVGIFMMVPFMAVHALKVTGKPESFLGWLVTAQMIGALAGNMAAGFLGDRHGGRVPSLAGRALLAVTCGMLIFSSTEPSILLAFFCFGMGSAMSEVGSFTLSIDICPPERRPTYVAIPTALALPAMLVAALLGTLIKQWTGSFQAGAAAALVCVALSAFFNARIREHRHQSAT